MKICVCVELKMCVCYFYITEQIDIDTREGERVSGKIVKNAKNDLITWLKLESNS